MLSLALKFLRDLAAGFLPFQNFVLANLAFRHRPPVLNHSVKPPALGKSERLFWADLSATGSRWTTALAIVQPQTVAR